MNEVRGEVTGEKILVHLSGRIDSGNAAQAEAVISGIIPEGSSLPVEIAADDLAYISSAGLRVILRLRKDHPDLRITGASTEVYDILDMTGFTEMMPVEKGYRKISIEGAEEIGRGAKGIVYRIDTDNVVKVYKEGNALEEIRHEREVARKALILGIPTAISYDVVRVGNSYGAVFELLNASSFSKILAEHPEKMDWCVDEFVGLLKKIHSIRVPQGELPDALDWLTEWAEFVQPYLPEWAGKKLLSMVREIPRDDHLIHGDYHTKNVELADDEVLLIDMDTLSVGNPVIELGGMFNASVGYSEYDPEVIRQFQGFDFETGQIFWRKVLTAYLGTDNEAKLRQVEDKARIVGYVRMIRRAVRKGDMETEEGRKAAELRIKKLVELLERTDTLLFTRNELEVRAVRENLPQVIDFTEKILDETDCPMKTRMQIALAVEEVFVNIASYAYTSKEGLATVCAEITEDPRSVVLTFIDSGMPYDPLKKDDPDVTLSASEREIGGLGIFMVKKLMDDIHYAYRDGKNVLVLRKKF
ncbi:MAG: ATP-binding protein [Flexilinea sp.]|nr:ATP-binding protein [Flexilinea sp.]